MKHVDKNLENDFLFYFKDELEKGGSFIKIKMYVLLSSFFCMLCPHDTKAIKSYVDYKKKIVGRRRRQKKVGIAESVLSACVKYFFKVIVTLH